LARRKYQVLVIHILEPDELEPDLLGDIALVDAEGDRERSLFIDRELALRYNQEMQNYLTEIEQVCATRGIDYLRTTTRVPFDEFVLKSLRQVSSVS
jgi:hypothetical protein